MSLWGQCRQLVWEEGSGPEDLPDSRVLSLQERALRQRLLHLRVEQVGTQICSIEGFRRRKLPAAVPVVQLAEQPAHGRADRVPQRLCSRPQGGSPARLLHPEHLRGSGGKAQLGENTKNQGQSSAV